MLPPTTKSSRKNARCQPVATMPCSKKKSNRNHTDSPSDLKQRKSTPPNGLRNAVKRIPQPGSNETKMHPIGKQMVQKPNLPAGEKNLSQNASKRKPNPQLKKNAKTESNRSSIKSDKIQPSRSVPTGKHKPQTRQKSEKMEPNWNSFLNDVRKTVEKTVRT